MQSWDDTDLWSKAMLLAYQQIRQIEELEEKIEFAKATIPRM